MKITFVDGSPESDQKTGYPGDLVSTLQRAGHPVHLFEAEKMNIHYCTGCWSCWWKTPGCCAFRDDMEGLYKSYLSSDLVLHFSPISMGFVSSRLKTINDRSIPLVHPYTTLVENECHHKRRYDRYPMFGLIVDPRGADSEELDITRNLYARMALNLKSELKFFFTTEQKQEELIDEISRL
ncbi:MAG TPA: NAD(P)H-dependent oxidoreductase [Prolixibacteraceae bacterium]|nr:NAD(P)H-dependent oxidoreductase [Prolixibacteraceae bacterium]